MTYFSLLVQSKVGKRKHTPASPLIFTHLQFSLRKFSNSPPAAQTNENFLKIANRSDGSDGAPILFERYLKCILSIDSKVRSFLKMFFEIKNI